METLSLVFVGVSVLLLAWQSYEVAKQGRISNQVAMASMVGQTGAELNLVHQILVDRPQLWAYLYGGRPAPEAGTDLAAQVSTVSEMLADCIEGALQIGLSVPSFGSVNLEDWRAYGRSVLATSPSIAESVRSESGASYWPCYHKMAQELPEVSGDDL